jgi:hypothetical protein
LGTGAGAPKVKPPAGLDTASVSGVLGGVPKPKPTGLPILPPALNVEPKEKGVLAPLPAPGVGSGLPKRLLAGVSFLSSCFSDVPEVEPPNEKGEGFDPNREDEESMLGKSGFETGGSGCVDEGLRRL